MWPNSAVTSTNTLAKSVQVLGSDAVVSTLKLVNGVIEPGAVVCEGGIADAAPRVTQTELDDAEPLVGKSPLRVMGVFRLSAP